MHDVNFIVCATLLNQQVKSSTAFDVDGNDNAKAVKDDKNVKDVKDVKDDKNDKNVKDVKDVKDVKADTNQLPLPTDKK